jgi:Uma2 family endonuclease
VNVGSEEDEIMATVNLHPLVRDGVFYPETDGRPMGETPLHGRNAAFLWEELEAWFAHDPQAFIAANLFVYYEHGNPRRHVSPDVFVARGVPKERSPKRRWFLRWEEGKGPDVVIEITSESTQEEDQGPKLELYRDTLKVSEYFLYDPYADYLDPPLIGYRLRAGRYVRIRPVQGRLPSKVLGLHLEIGGEYLRLYDPAAGRWLPTPREEREARQQAEAEAERLRRELEELRRRLPPGS